MTNIYRLTREQQFEASQEARNLRINAMESALKIELKVMYLAALNGHNVFLPYVTTGHPRLGVHDTERTMSVWEDVLTAMAEVNPDLLKALFSQSECPLVKAIKVAMAENYPERWAEKLAVHRVEMEQE